jgi:DNA-binding NtrC family response regulator
MPEARADAVGDAPTRPTVLVVDDERNIRRTLDLVLRGDGYEVVEAGDAEQALEMLEHGDARVDLAILDINLPGMSGVELLAKLRVDTVLADLPVIVISGHAAREDVAQAIKLGAADFFEKPLSRDRVLVSVRNALHAFHLSRAVASLRAEVGHRYEMIGESPAMQRLRAEIARVAPTRASVLITGETGTGKELVSRALHRLSGRANGPFIRINCAAIPQHLVESELFGFERSAFSGADRRKRGLFEAAHGGTLLLDEVGDMEIAAQAKVLRALESGEIVRVGGLRPIRVDVRILAATHRDLKQAIAGGRFREDLYFRLAVFPIRAPSLAERPGDRIPLAESFLAAFCKENGLPPKVFAPEVHAELARRTFPGNVRELRNAVERAAILSGTVVTIADLAEDPHSDPFADDPDPAAAAVSSTPPWSSPEPEPDDDPVPPTPRAPSAPAGVSRAPDPAPIRPSLASSPETPPPPLVQAALPESPVGPVPTLKEVRDRAERAHIVKVLAGVRWNVALAAPILGLERTNVHKRIRMYGIKRGEKPGP